MSAGKSAVPEPGDVTLEACPAPCCRVRLCDGRVMAGNRELRDLLGEADSLEAVFGDRWLEQFETLEATGTREGLIQAVDGRRLHARMKPCGDDEAVLVLTPAMVEARADDLQQVIEMLSEVVWEWNLQDDSVRYLGHGIHRAGYSSDAVPARGSHWEAYIHSEDLDRVSTAIVDYLTGNAERYRVEYRLKQGDGSYRWVLGRGRIVERDADGKPLRMLGLITDIQQRREREEEQARLEAQLRHVQKLDALGQLTGGIAHDFNNILASVLGYAELGLLETGDPRLTEFFEEILRASERGRDLIAKLLLFSRSGHDAAAADVTAALGGVSDTLRMLRPMLPATLSLDIEIDDGLPDVRMDPSQLQQLVLNLAINARDALGENGRIAVSVRRGRKGRGVCASCGAALQRSTQWIELEVSDDGPGIDEDARGRIFDPFFSTKEVGRGAGLGLSVVHGIVHEHGGHILLDSEEGSGTHFTVLLHAAAETAVSRPAGASAAVTLAGAGSRILIVDDEPAIGAWMATLLERHGFNVEVFLDSSAALARFEESEEDWNLVITDQSMPELSGVELADELIALQPDLPILICSGFSEFVDASNARDLGFREYLQKPLSARDLLMAVGRCLPGNVTGMDADSGGGAG